MLDRGDDRDIDFKNLRRLVAAWEGTSLFSKIMNARKDHRRDQTVISGEKQAVVLIKFGHENMKIDLTSGRRARNEVFEKRLNQFTELMDLVVRQDDVKCEVKEYFKTYSSLHLVTARGDGSKPTCSCLGHF